MRIDTAIAVAAIVLAIVWPTHQQLTIRALRHSLRRQRDQLAQHGRAIVQLQGAAIQPPTSVGQPMPTVSRSERRDPRSAMAIPATHYPWQEGANGGRSWATKQAGLRSTPPNESHGPEACIADPDPTLRLRRPPALSDVAAAILGAGRPLTRATLTTQLNRDVRTEIRAALLGGTLEMVRTHDDEPCYWPTGHPVPGDTIRMAKMPVLPGIRP